MGCQQPGTFLETEPVLMAYRPTLATANFGNCQQWQHANNGNKLPTLATSFCQLWQRLANNGNRFLPTMATDKIPLMSVKKLQKADLNDTLFIEILYDVILPMRPNVKSEHIPSKRRNSV